MQTITPSVLVIFVLWSDIDLSLECSCEHVRSMEEPCIEQRPASPCGVWASQYVESGLQSVCGCVARDELGGTIGLCL